VGLIEEIEARASRRDGPPEPAGRRARRRIGAGLLIAGAIMCSITLLGTRWWRLDLMVVGSSASLEIGLTHAELCVTDSSSVECRAVSADDLAGLWASQAVGDYQENRRVVHDWLGHRRAILFATLAAVVASLLLMALSIGYWPHRHLRIALIAAATLVPIAAGFTIRFVRAAPIDTMSRDLSSFLAMGGLGSLVLGVVLIATAARTAHPALPPAVARPRTGEPAA